MPAAAPFGVEVHFDADLRDRNGAWASRRVGVWQVTGSTPGGDEFGFGVITPRLTVSSLFTDPLFAPSTEAPAAALVRSLVLRRIVDRHLGDGGLVTHRIGDAVPDIDADAKSRPIGHLRGVPARVGAKPSEASLSAALAFLAAFPDPEAVWDTQGRWADRGFRTRPVTGSVGLRAGRVEGVERPPMGDTGVFPDEPCDDLSERRGVLAVLVESMFDRLGAERHLHIDP